MRLLVFAEKNLLNDGRLVQFQRDELWRRVVIRRPSRRLIRWIVLANVAANANPKKQSKTLIENRKSFDRKNAVSPAVRALEQADSPERRRRHTCSTFGTPKWCPPKPLLQRVHHWPCVRRQFAMPHETRQNRNAGRESHALPIDALFNRHSIDT